MAEAKSIISVPGSCNCGGVEYELKIDLANSPENIICHCTICRKANGSLHGANTLLPETSFHLKSSDTLKGWTDNTADSGFTVIRHFCGTCGSFIYSTNPKWAGNVVVSSGTMALDPKSRSFTTEQGTWSWKPNLEVFARNRPEWGCTVSGDFPRFEHMPSKD